MPELKRRRWLVVLVVALAGAGCDGDCLSRTELYRCTCTPASPSSPLHCATDATQAVSLARSTCSNVNCQCTCTFEASDCDPNHNERCPR